MDTTSVASPQPYVATGRLEQVESDCTSMSTSDDDDTEIGFGCGSAVGRGATTWDQRGAPSSTAPTSLGPPSESSDALDGAKVGSQSRVKGKGIGLHRRVVSVPAAPPLVGSNSGPISAAEAAQRALRSHPVLGQLSPAELCVAAAAWMQR